MSEKAVREAVCEYVALRNFEARCQALLRVAGAVVREASVPEVGIFWMSLDGKHFHKKTVRIRDAESYGEFRIMDYPHYSEWSSAQRKVRAWKGREYDEVPRGRVVLRVKPGDNRFVIFMPKELKRFERKVLSEFRIPGSLADFDYSDIHYRMDRKVVERELGR